MKYQLNFLSTAAFRRKQEHRKQFIFAIVAIIWVFSGVILTNIYNSIKYKTAVYESKFSEVEGNIVNIQPELWYLNRLVEDRNKLKKYLPLYLQDKSRPSVWQSRLYDIADLLPTDLVLSRIEFKPFEEEKDAKKNGKKPALKKEDIPEITVDGFMLFKNESQDIYSVEDYRNKLLESTTTEPTYSRIDVMNNRIYKDDDELKLIFSLGYFQ